MRQDPTKLLVEKASDLADEAITYCESQTEIWQMIPYWAWRADGRDGFSGQLSNAYRTGYWWVTTNLHIDCSNGRLVSRGHSLAPPINLVLALLPKVQLINASKILSTLMHEAMLPINDCMRVRDEEELAKIKGKQPSNPYVRNLTVAA